MKSIVKYFIFFSLFTSCQRAENTGQENAHLLAKRYCDCINYLSQKDSIINAQACASKVFSESRFFNIRFSEEQDKYTKSTIDSAEYFFTEVGNIIDSQCIKKFPRTRFKKEQLRWQ
jgi:hypothetical protein